MGPGIIMVLLSWHLALPGHFHIPAALCQPYDGGRARPAVDSTVIHVSRDIRIGDYFQYLDSLVAMHRMQVPYPLTEHVLVHANPWIIDSLSATDYYHMMVRDSFVYDQKGLVIMPEGSRIVLPDSSTGERLHRLLKSFRLDINIPEFRLRIYADSTELYDFPVRVGQNRKRFLAQSGRVTDLRTQTGSGRIIRHVRDPAFYNPVDGRRFYSTERDDGRRTLMPLIPWIETEIDGRRNGQMIHPTTNPSTLGKAYSNGCIGTSEAAAWIIYYHAPLGAPVHIRYDLEVPDGQGGTHRLPNIYGY